MTFDPAAPPAQPASRPPRRGLIGQVIIVLMVLGLLVFGISPSPYVVERPGPAYDTLGTVRVDGDEVPVIQIDDADTYPTDGRLDLLTVYLDGSREHPQNWFEIIRAAIDPSRAVLPVDAVFPEGQSDEESSQASALDMRISQQAAQAAALTALGIPLTPAVAVLDVTADGPADGVLEVGDEVLSIDGVAISTDPELRQAIADAGVGTELQFGIRRDGRERTVTVVPGARSASDSSPMIGIIPTETYEFPFDITINLQSVGGPSAGMMFALGIYDRLTPGPLTGGEHIAGTGTITADGAVGPIGGIQQKMIGARDAGARWFLAPASNCEEVVGSVPTGLQVFKVSEFDEALAIVTAIGMGESTASFPRCS